MEHSRGNNDDEIRIMSSNTVFDVYLAQVYSQFMKPYVFLYLLLFLWINYSSSLFLIKQKEFFSLSISLAINIVWVLGIIYIIPMVFLAYNFITKRLKGIIGRHDFIFSPDSFIEKTDYNQQTIKYASIINFLQTGRYYVLCLQGHQTFIFHKRDLSQTILARINRISHSALSPKKFNLPLVSFILFIISLMFAGSVYPLSKYTIHTNKMPFFFAWNDNEFYVYGGKLEIGVKDKYIKLPFLNDRNHRFQQPFTSTKHFLWVAKDGKITRHPIKNIKNPGVIHLHNNKLILVSVDTESFQKKLFFWKENTFQEESGINAQVFLKDINDELIKHPEKLGNMINEFEWSANVGNGVVHKVTLGGREFELKMKRGDISKDSINESVFLLSARWPETEDNFSTIFSFSSGSFKVDKKQFNETFRQ